MVDPALHRRAAGRRGGRQARMSASPRARFSQSTRLRLWSANCGIISLWWMMGPAIRWGKKVTKST